LHRGAINLDERSKINRIEVKIQGKEYTIRGMEDVGYLQQIANFVDDKMEEITSKYPQLNTTFAAVLTCVNVTDLYFKEIIKNKEEESEKCKQLLENMKKLEEINFSLKKTENEYINKIKSSEVRINQLENEKNVIYKNSIQNMQRLEREKKDASSANFNLLSDIEKMQEIIKENEKLSRIIKEKEEENNSLKEDVRKTKEEFEAFISEFDKK
jgi:cell division protein ZapA